MASRGCYVIFRLFIRNIQIFKSFLISTKKKDFLKILFLFVQFRWKDGLIRILKKNFSNPQFPFNLGLTQIFKKSLILSCVIHFPLIIRNLVIHLSLMLMRSVQIHYLSPWIKTNTTEQFSEISLSRTDHYR